MNVLLLGVLAYAFFGGLRQLALLRPRRNDRQSIATIDFTHINLASLQ